MKSLQTALLLLALLFFTPFAQASTAGNAHGRVGMGIPSLDAGETLTVEYPHFTYVLHSSQPDQAGTPATGGILTATWKWHGNNMKLEVNQQPGETDDGFANRFLKKVKAIQLLFPPDAQQPDDTAWMKPEPMLGRAA